MRFIKKAEGRYDSVGGKYRIERLYPGIWEVFTQEAGVKRESLGMFYTLKRAQVEAEMRG